MKLLWISKAEKIFIIYAESPVRLLGVHLFSRKRKYRLNGNGWGASNSFRKVSRRKKELLDQWLEEQSVYFAENLKKTEQEKL